jgi:GT2 family glycosyltransferase
MIYLNTPIGKKEEFGNNINRFVDIIGNDDWALIVDHDTLFTTTHWFGQVISATKKGDALLTCVMNKSGNPPQKIDCNSDSLEEHFKKGRELYEQYGSEMEKISGEFCAAFMLFPKKIWEDVGGFKSGFRGIDYDFFKRVGDKYPIKLLKGLYIYHRKISNSK